MSASSIVKQNEKLGILVSIASCAILGIYPAASQAAYADGANATFVLFLTTFIRMLMLSAPCFLKRRVLFENKKNVKAALMGGFWQAVAGIGIMTSLLFIPGPVMLIIILSHALMLLFFMAWRGEIELDKATVLSTISALIGLTFVVDLWYAQPVSNWIGIGLAFMVAIAAVNRIYVYGQQMKTRNPMVVGAESFVFTMIFVLPVALWQGPQIPMTWAGWGWSVLSGLSLSIGGGYGMFYGIALLGSFRWSLFAKTEPIFTSLFAVLFLGQYLKWSQYGGILLVIVSLVVYQVLNQRRMKKKAFLLGEGQ